MNRRAWMILAAGLAIVVGIVPILLLNWPLEAQFLEPVVTSKILATYTIVRTNYTTTVTDVSATTSTYIVTLATESLTVKPDKFAYSNGRALFIIVWIVCMFGISVASCSVWQPHDIFWRIFVSAMLSFAVCFIGAIAW